MKKIMMKYHLRNIRREGHQIIERAISYFLVFLWGVFLGYYWMVKAYGVWR